MAELGTKTVASINGQHYKVEDYFYLAGEIVVSDKEGETYRYDIDDVEEFEEDAG